MLLNLSDVGCWIIEKQCKLYCHNHKLKLKANIQYNDNSLYIEFQLHLIRHFNGQFIHNDLIWFTCKSHSSSLLSKKIHGEFHNITHESLQILKQYENLNYNYNYN